LIEQIQTDTNCKFEQFGEAQTRSVLIY